MVVGGGIGTIVVVVVVVVAIVWLLGGDPSQVLNVLNNQGSQLTATIPAQDSMAQFVSVVLADTEEIWGYIFASYG